ncbi:SMI1/KNR4 family protein [Hymenobacter sp.]|jgi:hypothetical protein|uniref:SMI1/KNR4 family protein n=1 Tax=Hymenobacter sp. TaxID=1898978 RepID=UPI002ED7F2DD
MPKTIEEIIYRLRTEGEQLGITLYPAASSAEIRDFELKLKIKLPDEAKAFYQFCNGFESEEDLFRIIPLDEISSNIQSYKPHQFYIAEYLMYCDEWTIGVNPLNNNEYGICNHHEFIKEICLTDSLPDFLECFLSYGLFKANGLYDLHHTRNIF